MHVSVSCHYQIPSQEAITFSNIVFQSMSGFFDGIARIHGTHSLFVRSMFVRSFGVCFYVISIILSFFIHREREREREREKETVLRLVETDFKLQNEKQFNYLRLI